MQLDEHVRLSRLLDIYGAFLTSRQWAMLNQYINDDLSLFELSEIYGVSRQAVRDTVLKGQTRLAALENILKLLARTDSTALALASLLNEADNPNSTSLEGVKREAKNIADIWNINLEDLTHGV